MHVRIVRPIKDGLIRLKSAVKSRKRSLVVRSIIFATALVVLGLVMRLLILLPVLKDQVRELASQQQETIADYVASDIAATMSEREAAIGRLAADFPAELVDTPETSRDWLSRHDRLLLLFPKGLILIPVDGTTVAVEHLAGAQRHETSSIHSGWFDEVLRDKDLFSGKLVHRYVTQIPALLFAAPVRDANGHMVAVLAGVSALTDPNFFAHLLEKRHRLDARFMLVAPQENLILTSRTGLMTFDPIPAAGQTPLFDKSLTGFRGSGLVIAANGAEELWTIASVESRDWFLISAVPTKDIFRPVERVKFFILRNAVVVMVVALFLVPALTRYYLGPLVSTSRLIHRMANGEIELQPVPVKWRDEVGELAMGFNVLLARLGEITMQKLASERERVQEKERIEVLLRQWMTDTSHELRTPIAVLQAQIEAIQDGVHSANDKTLGVLHREVLGLSRLVDDLHTLALSDVGQFRGQSVPVDPLAVLEDVAQAFRERFVKAGLDIRWEQSPVNAVPLILFDPSHLRRVFSNLLENTVRYTDTGGYLSISSWEEADSLTVQFDDTAPGVSSDALPRLFERFFRVDTSRSRDSGGTGIGLAVCRTIVEAFGGTIAARLSPLGGLRIVVQFPVFKGER